jgi:excisionase family DNA binding protein
MNGTETESGLQPHGHGASERLRRMLQASAEELEIIDRLLAGRWSQENGRVRPEDLLTKKELAARMRVTVRTVENWRKKGALRFIKLGNTVLFHWPDLMGQLRANSQVCRKENRCAE